MKKFIRLIAAICFLYFCFIIWPAPLPSIYRFVFRRTPVPILQKELGSEDFNQLLDIQNFSYQMVQPECTQNVVALFIVFSEPKNKARRLLIRRTWGQEIWFNSDTPFRLLFFLGSVENQTLQQTLQEENAVFDDMVQGNFIDSHWNMTYKYMMSFKWFIYHCPYAHILINVFDDTLVNTPQLEKYLKPKYDPFSWYSTNNRFSPARDIFDHPKDLIFCEKWLSLYCLGFAIIYSPDVVYSLYKQKKTKYCYTPDEMGLMGIVSNWSNFSLTNMSPYVLSESDVHRIRAKEKDLFDVEFIFAFNKITKSEYMKLWQVIWVHYELDTFTIF